MSSTVVYDYFQKESTNYPEVAFITEYFYFSYLILWVMLPDGSSTIVYDFSKECMISSNYPEVAFITECFYECLPSTVVSAALWCLILCIVRLAATLTAQNLKTMSLKNINQPISNTTTQIIILYINSLCQMRITPFSGAPMPDLNHSNAEATFIQSTKMHRFWQTV